MNKIVFMSILAAVSLGVLVAVDLAANDGFGVLGTVGLALAAAMVAAGIVEERDGPRWVSLVLVALIILGGAFLRFARLI